jgi:zinc protease
MKLAQRFRLTVLLAAIATTAVLVGAQTPAIPPNVAAAKLDDAVPVDPQITVGTLPNGLRYYIRLNRQPQGRRPARPRAFRRAHGVQRDAALSAA